MDKYIRERMYDDHVPGVALAIIRGANVLLQQGYGFANLEHRVPVMIDSVFEICSLSKQFTVAAIMRLVETGAVAVDDPIHAYLPTLPAAWQHISIRQLLTATSGIKDYLNDFQNTAAAVPVRESGQQILRYLSAHELNFSPGERWSYNNSGFVLLSLIVEQCTEMPYRTFLRTHLLEPLRLHATAANDLRRVIPSRVNGYVWNEEGWRNREVLFAGKQSDGDGELVSTLADLIRWDTAWRDPSFLGASTLEQIWTPATTNSGAAAKTTIDTAYGLGWFLGEHEGHRLCWTPGFGDGFSTTLARFPDDDLTVIVLCNLAQFRWADAVALDVAALVW